MNTPTPEQIDAALKIADNSKEHYPNSVPAILAAAYREQQREIEQIKQQRDTLADALRVAWIDIDHLGHFMPKHCRQKSSAALATLKGEA